MGRRASAIALACASLIVVASLSGCGSAEAEKLPGSFSSSASATPQKSAIPSAVGKNMLISQTRLEMVAGEKVAKRVKHGQPGAVGDMAFFATDGRLLLAVTVGSATMYDEKYDPAVAEKVTDLGFEAYKWPADCPTNLMMRKNGVSVLLQSTPIVLSDGKLVGRLRYERLEDLALRVALKL